MNGVPGKGDLQMAGSHAETQGIHMGSTWSLPGGMDLERQNVETAYLPFPHDVGSQALDTGAALGVRRAKWPLLAPAAVERPLSAPLPGALTHPAPDCC